MASIASRSRPLPRIRSLQAGVVVPIAFVLALMAISVFVRTRALGEALWMDEGLSIGVASQPFFDIPGTLRVDGAPPFYYMALSLWMDVFGRGPAETQGLSVAISLLAIPTGLWAGWSLFGPRAGYITAALFAVNSFLTVYAQETRMYALMVVLSLLVTAAFLHVFVYGRRRYLPLFIAVLALMLYTHNWGLFVTAGALVALVPCWLASGDRRGLVRDALIGFGGAGLLYAPWLPTLLHQVQHTGAPWLNAPRLGTPIQMVKVLGGGTVVVALLLAAGSALAMILRGERAGEPLRLAVPRGAREWLRTGSAERTAVVGAATLLVATLAIAWLFSQVSPAWTTRYLGVAVAPIVLLAGLGFARAGYLGLVGAAIVFAIWSVPKTFDLTHKSNAADLGSQASEQLRPGDLVISMQPEQTPLIDYQIGVSGLRYATPLGAVDKPQVMDWTDGRERMGDATTARNLEPLLARVPRSGRVLLVHPLTSSRDDWDAPWTALVRRRSAQWGAAMAEDGRFERVAVVPDFFRRSTRIGIRGVLYEKTG